jgi:replicative DNA helicase
MFKLNKYKRSNTHAMRIAAYEKQVASWEKFAVETEQRVYTAIHSAQTRMEAAEHTANLEIAKAQGRIEKTEQSTQLQFNVIQAQSIEMQSQIVAISERLTELRKTAGALVVQLPVKPEEVHELLEYVKTLMLTLSNLIGKDATGQPGLVVIDSMDDCKHK